MLEILLGSKKKNAAAYENFLIKISQAGIPTQGPAARIDTNNGYFTNVLANEAMRMWGSSWGSHLTTDSRTASAVRHAFPNNEAYAHGKLNKLQVAYKLNFIGMQLNYISVTRNGYTSDSYSSYQGTTMIDFIYYDPILKKMMRCNPHLMSAPVEWDGNFLS